MRTLLLLRHQFLIIFRAHTGTTSLGLNFSQVHSGWKTQIEEPFITYLNSVFSASPFFFYMLTSINGHPAREMRQAVALSRPVPTRNSSVLSTRAKGCSVNSDADTPDDAKNKTVDMEMLFKWLNDRNSQIELSVYPLFTVLMLMLHSRELESLIRFDKDEQDGPEQGDPKRYDPEQGQDNPEGPEQGNPKQDNPEGPEQGDPKLGDPDQGNSEQDDPEGPEQDNPKQDDPGKQDPNPNEQEEVDDIDKVDGVSSVASNLGAAPEVTVALPTSGPLLERDDWPQWLVDGVDYLQGVSTVETWTTFLVSFVRLERSLGFSSTVSKHHDVDSRKLTNLLK